MFRRKKSNEEETAAPQAATREAPMADTATAPTNEEMIAKLKEVNDPELMMSIVDLGLVYDVHYDNGTALVSMTLTSPGCPLGPVIRGEAYAKLRELPGIEDVDVEIVWTPRWDPRSMASDDVTMMLGIW
jgi:metal-sulfur cluster biosynthetic enzyme